MWGSRALLIPALLASSAGAQWLKVPNAAIPRNPDGTPDLNAPVPKTADGKPDLQGIWLSQNTGLLLNLAGTGTNAVKVPFQPWAEKLFQERIASRGIGDPEARCLPQGTPKMDVLPWPFKIIYAPGEVIILYETNNLWRQVFIDGRALPRDANPTWLGYSVGHWEEDAFVIDSTGFTDNMWIDTNGHPHTDALHVVEKIRRPDFGHLAIEITIDDPKAYTQPWTQTMRARLLPDTDLLEFVCEERSMPHMVGPGPSR